MDLPVLRWEFSETVGGVQTATLVFQPGYWPVPVGKDKYRLRAPVPFAIGIETVVEISTFIGLLSNDRAEVAIELEAIAEKDSPSGPRVYLRSFHRHMAGDFESWDHRQVWSSKSSGFIVVMEAQSMEHDRRIFFHGGVVLTLLK